jgi:hypothetical protein
VASYETPPAVELKIEGELCNITCFCKSISYTIIRHYLPYEIRYDTYTYYYISTFTVLIKKAVQNSLYRNSTVLS